MRYLKALIVLFIVSSLFTSCFEDNDDNQVSASQINDFVWKGMNTFYLYKDEVPDLANDRFSSDGEYASYLNSFSKPEDLFESLIYEPKTVDEFSWIVNDYIALEQFFSGIITSNGMEFGIFGFSPTDTNRYGYVRYILPNTSATNQDVKRGDIFYGINGTQLTSENWRTLTSADNYTINLGSYNDNGTPETTDDSVDNTSKSISLSKAQYTENPILINKVLDAAGTKVAYLMYNGFTGTDQFNAELNDAFGTFKSANATELVLDLRYNPGGSVNTAILLASMITGQFTGDVFSTEEWNSEFQQAFEDENPELLINRFVNNNNGVTLNSLNLTRVFILTTRSSASASELIINSLEPYINVVQIGTNTRGKYQASRTLYDSPNFSRSGANPSHTYAMQPLIFKSLNVNGKTDYFDGLFPQQNNILFESIKNLGVLGDENEPLLARAISIIDGSGKFPINKSDKTENRIEISGNSKDLLPFANDMYIDKDIPNDLIKRVLFE
ncbi:S41 family peptidase [Sabulilitoribacter arenilitoris]|uniref:S41 family peptidase n=1 Tax=Wocania arenilitoris TaxID=2044858 RepID=A0AAE3JND1_9FLAO|nr:S41 family peptidase [Wocania arenilitoris]MCF7568551.1 S41 family peptidase [Wocania arenilitoris]